MMIDEHTLQQIVKRIVAAAQPSRVILFGSSLTGAATLPKSLTWISS